MQNEVPAPWQFNQQPAPQAAPTNGAWIQIAQQPQPRQATDQPEAVQPEPQPKSSPGVVSNEVTEKRAAQLKLITSQQETATKRSEELAEETKQWEANIIRLRDEGLSEPTPYSFLLLDKSRDDVAAEIHNGELIDDAIDAVKKEIAAAKADQESKQRDLHRAQDKLNQSSDSAAVPELRKSLAEAQHALEVATETLKFHRLELDNLKLEQHLQELRLVHAQEKNKRYEQDVVFTLSMLHDVLSELTAREKDLATRTGEIEDDLNKFLDDQRYQALKRLDDAKASQDQAKLPALEAEVKAKNDARRTAQLEAKLIAEQQEQIRDLKQAWEHRYALANEAVPAADSANWIAETKAVLDQLRLETDEADSAIENNRKQLAAVERKLQTTGESEAGLRYWLTRSSTSLQQQRKLYEDMLVQMEPTRRVFEKLLDDLTRGDLTVAVGRWAAEAWRNIEGIWEYELLWVNKESSITVGKIVQAVILLFLGFYASRLISRSIGRRMLSRMGFDASATAAMQSVAFYVLVLIFTLFALKVVKVPLTVFTVLGGALALGIGFGSQNIVNNFISGLILLAERPVKVGDLIQLNNIYGNVEHIGARSTRVRTGENLEIIVPNSTFLETNVVNWTLSDNNMRTKVIFGVVYGSPLGKVTHLALKAAANHDRVFDRPEPFLIFDEFGDNALVFELHFWVAVRTLMERRKIESDIRFNLDHLYREAGIVIAFPQRDVHLFTERPLQVQMAPPPTAPSDSNAA